MTLDYNAGSEIAPHCNCRPHETPATMIAPRVLPMIATKHKSKKPNVYAYLCGNCLELIPRYRAVSLAAKKNIECCRMGPLLFSPSLWFFCSVFFGIRPGLVLPEE